MEELAEKLSMDAQTLQATFDRYQELCAAGEDTDYGKDASHLIAYSDEGGYYAAYLQAASWGTIGGAGTNVSLGAEATEETLGTGNLVIALLSRAFFQREGQ